ncbi:MAG: polysaccharide biosynthesis tyrosine autokinase [Sphingobacteriales bacterium]|nr:MAG: polysaccharide biosynthesis tyrosine autokinase [Sphingobacteriales bacterium]
MAKQLQPIFSNNSNRKKGDPLSLEKLRGKAIQYLPMFVLFLVLSLVAGFVYLKTTTPVYEVNARLVLDEDNKDGMGQGQIFQELGVQSGKSKIDNEIEIFRSKHLMKKVVNDLYLNIRYYQPGRLKTTELYYDNSPFRIVPLYSNTGIKEAAKYNCKINGSGITISDDKQHSWPAKMGDTVALPTGKVLLLANVTDKPVAAGQEMFFVINTVDKTAKKFLKAFSVGKVNNQVSIVQLAIHDVSPQRGEDIINKLIQVYTEAFVDSKNRTADGTIAFIDDRLKIVTSELSNIETTIEGFKRDNSLTDVEAQSKFLLENSADAAKELTQQEVQLNVIESVERSLDNPNSKVVPSVFFMQDPALVALITSYNQLLAERERLLLTNVETSPYVQNLDNQLRNTRSTMRQNLGSLKKSMEISLGGLYKQRGQFSSQIKEVPAKEKEFLEYSRQQNIKQELYLFLLKKREETAINRSSTGSNTRIVDPAEREDKPVAPNKLAIIMSAIAFGLLIPGVRVLLKEVFNVKVSGREDITRLTEMAVIGEIGHNTKEAMVVATKGSRSKLAEQFRALRTNLQFLLSGENEKTILVTSSMSGEGKSFVSVNIASTLALQGKKIVLLELDLRKPKISEGLGIQQTIGFSSYAIGKATLDDVIVPSGVHENFYVVPCGALPPNPAELLTLPQVNKMFEALEDHFDYVIIDTAPVGLVTDAQLLASYADVTVYVVRHGHTYKEQVEAADDLYEKNKMPRMNIVLNDVKTGGSAYGYGAYGNTYYEAEENGWAGQLKNKLRNSFNKRS